MFKILNCDLRIIKSANSKIMVTEFCFISKIYCTWLSKFCISLRATGLAILRTKTYTGYITRWHPILRANREHISMFWISMNNKITIKDLSSFSEKIHNSGHWNSLQYHFNISPTWELHNHQKRGKSLGRTSWQQCMSFKIMTFF